MSNRNTPFTYEVVAFMFSARGQFIMAQALNLAIAKLEAVENPRDQAPSDVADMKYILENAFPTFAPFAGKDLDQLYKKQLEELDELRAKSLETRNEAMDDGWATPEWLIPE